MTVLLLANDVNQSVKSFVSVGDRLFSSLLGFCEFFKRYVHLRKLIVKRAMFLASCLPLTQSRPNHEFGDSFQSRKAYLVLLIINSDPREGLDDELHLPF